MKTMPKIGDMVYKTKPDAPLPHTRGYFMMLRAMYFMLGGVVGMALVTNAFNKRLDAIVSAIPPLAGASAWVGCATGRNVPKLECEDLGKQIMRELEQELRK